jgi:hypothetical protein
MKEVYDQYCIPVFGAPLTPMGRWNKYSCDFLNVILLPFPSSSIFMSRLGWEHEHFLCCAP